MILHIMAVDGERSYSIETPDKKEALEFLTRYDHEGAGLQLDLESGQEALYDNEDIHEALRPDMKQVGRLTRKMKVSMAEVQDVPLSFTSPESAAVESASYDPLTEILTVTLKPGKVFTYQGVPAATWKGFVEAESKGRFFQSAIRPRYLARKA